jgi:hypothetical protein
MHGAELVTPGVLLMLCIGLAAFIVIFRFIFRKPGK